MARIEMIKFGEFLNGRPAGREAALRAIQILNGSAANEEVVVDFAHVRLLTPSFADEFLTTLGERYGQANVKVENADTPVIQDALRILETV